MSDHKLLGMTNEPQLLAHGTNPARQTVLSGPRLDSKIVVIERKNITWSPTKKKQQSDL